MEKNVMETNLNTKTDNKIDLRTKKTLRSIKNAFLQLRAHKPVERISVKELADLAEISKATFYLHYHDIFDLSEQMQQEVIQDILNDIPIQSLISNGTQLTHVLYHSFIAHETMIDILFSGTQSSILADTIESELRKELLKSIPEDKQNDFLEDARFNILLTYQIQGGHYTFLKCRKQYGSEKVIDVLTEMNVL